MKFKNLKYLTPDRPDERIDEMLERLEQEEEEIFAEAERRRDQEIDDGLTERREVCLD